MADKGKSDITAELRKSLEESRANFASIVEKSADGIIIVDREGVVRFVNPSAEFLFGKKRDEFIGKSFGLPISEEESTEIDIIKKGGRGTGEIRIVETKWKGDDAYLVLTHDITDRKKYEEGIKKQLEELKELDRAKTEFISIAGHELKNPLQSLILAGEMLSKDEGISESSRSYIDVINGNTKRLKSLVSSLLDLSTLELKKAKFLMEKISSEEIILSALQEMKLSAKERGIEIKYNSKGGSIWFMGDKERLNQVLANLIGNAIKAMENGGLIELSAKDKGNEIEFSVKDNGPGIPKELRKLVFDKFFQVHPMINRKEGFGLGLAISKEIINAHQGRIWCKTSEGKGTTFFFCIPKNVPK